MAKMLLSYCRQCGCSHEPEKHVSVQSVALVESYDRDVPIASVVRARKKNTGPTKTFDPNCPACRMRRKMDTARVTKLRALRKKK